MICLFGTIKCTEAVFTNTKRRPELVLIFSWWQWSQSRCQNLEHNLVKVDSVNWMSFHCEVTVTHFISHLEYSLFKQNNLGGVFAHSVKTDTEVHTSTETWHRKSRRPADGDGGGQLVSHHLTVRKPPPPSPKQTNRSNLQTLFMHTTALQLVTATVTISTSHCDCLSLSMLQLQSPLTLASPFSSIS